MTNSLLKSDSYFSACHSIRPGFVNGYEGCDLSEAGNPREYRSYFCPLHLEFASGPPIQWLMDAFSRIFFNAETQRIAAFLQRLHRQHSRESVLVFLCDSLRLCVLCVSFPDPGIVPRWAIGGSFFDRERFPFIVTVHGKGMKPRRHGEHGVFQTISSKKS